MKHIVLIVGTRPNFIKVAPLYCALKNNFKITLIHTGQHFDRKMSNIFFDQLCIPYPDIHFTIKNITKSGIYDNKLYTNNDIYLTNKEKVIDDLINTNGKDMGQLGEIKDMLINCFENIIPNLVIVFGDVTSTLAASLAAKKLNIKIAHVESGLRSNDLSMPEEVNRILIDYITDYYFVTEQNGVCNLKKEEMNREHVYLVGDIMIDTQKKFIDLALSTKYYKKLELIKGKYIVVTLHRPGNVDNLNKLKKIFNDLLILNEKIVYPIHHRTKKNLKNIGYLDKIKNSKNILLISALGYLEFTNLIANCKYVITDSGSLQTESAVLNIPCFTLRPNTERPCTLIENYGTNQLINNINEIKLIKCDNKMKLCDGKCCRRIKKILDDVIIL